jgi:hypothetical protein
VGISWFLRHLRETLHPGDVGLSAGVQGRTLSSDILAAGNETHLLVVLTTPPGSLDAARLELKKGFGLRRKWDARARISGTELRF